MITCKECTHWEQLLSVRNMGVCKNRCGKVKVQCNESDRFINKEINVLTDIDFGCVSGINKGVTHGN